MAIELPSCRWTWLTISGSIRVRKNYTVARGYHRSLCLGCQHLIPDPREKENAIKWRVSYARQAKELEAEGAVPLQQDRSAPCPRAPP